VIKKLDRNPPKVINVETIAKTRIFEIERLELQFSNGVETQFERLRSSPYGAVLVVPMLDNETVLLIREYAAGVERYELALPKGRIEKNEDPLVAANREIMEEIGYGSNKLKHIHSFSIAPGYLSHVTHIILAQDLFRQKEQGDEPEEIEVIPWKLSKLNDLLKDPECSEARSIAALFMVKEKLQTLTDKL